MVTFGLHSFTADRRSVIVIRACFSIASIFFAEVYANSGEATNASDGEGGNYTANEL